MTIPKLKELMAQGDHKGFLTASLNGSLEHATVNEQLHFAAYLGKIPPGLLEELPLVHKKIAVLGGYNTKFLCPLIRWQLFHRGINSEILESDYGLFEQLIFSEDQQLKKFAPDVVYFCVGQEHLNLNNLSAEKERWCTLWEKTNQWLKCDILQNSCVEPMHLAFQNFEYQFSKSLGFQVRKLNQQLFESAPSYVKFCDIDALSANIGRRQWRDEKLYDVSKVPVAFSFLPNYAENVAGVLGAIFGKSKKCLVLDLDNTLWGGIVGDDGWENLKISNDNPTGESFYRFQKFILELKNRGVILAVCSKNEESVAKEVFQKKNMVLKLEDMSAFRANWDPKSENIRAIAKELNIALDYIVFVDDNTVECEQVKGSLSAVEVLLLPKDSSQYVAALSCKNYFETVGVTEEDLQKTEQYLANRQREELGAQVTNFSDFLGQLKMTAECAPFDAANLMRITQLINKTNQFNLTTRRYTEAQLSEIMKDSQWVTRFLKLKDKFGDNGLVANVMAKIHANTLEIDTWLMSCRVLKRGVEDFLMREMVREAKSRNMQALVGHFSPTEKNMMVREFFSGFGFTLKAESVEGSTSWVLDLGDTDKVAAILQKEICITEEVHESLRKIG